MADENKEPQTGKRSNTGMIMLIVTMVILALVIGYFVFFDKKGYNTSSVRNTPLTSANRLPLLGANGSPLNSASISSGGGYGGKFNSY